MNVHHLFPPAVTGEQLGASVLRRWACTLQRWGTGTANYCGKNGTIMGLVALSTQPLAPSSMRPSAAFSHSAIVSWLHSHELPWQQQ
jgi:hypothetical protein